MSSILLPHVCYYRIDHWNNEKEKILLLTDKTLLICKYDFIMLSCVQMQQIPLSAICRICLGKFIFPGISLDKSENSNTLNKHVVFLTKACHIKELRSICSFHGYKK
ncbi:Tumor protein p63-regulated gene 1 protein [Cricetulus griseus]|uniref:Tumor protein p63-regulated gene 1 protein n=1 Tax=Cricetulus griseus TaxID=10029 RepID=G3GT85_CRIGR|nr:Tumor protein p63-regulated gene 1 protein [Cricetulus griseus]